MKSYMKPYHQAWLILALSLSLLFSPLTSAMAWAITEEISEEMPNVPSSDKTVLAVNPTNTLPSSPALTPSTPSASASMVGESVTKPSDYFGQIMLSLVLVLAIIFLAAWLLRRYGRFPGVAEGHLKVLGALSVGQRERILLLQVGSEQILVGVTTSKITTLHQLEEPVKVKDNASLSSSLMKTSFSQRLQDALKAKDATKTTRVEP